MRCSWGTYIGDPNVQRFLWIILPPWKFQRMSLKSHDHCYYQFSDLEFFWLLTFRKKITVRRQAIQLYQVFGGRRPSKYFVDKTLKIVTSSCSRNITPTGSALPRLQEVEDLQGDDLLYYDAEIKLTNMILLSIPNEIYNSVDSCKTAKEMWDRVERLMRGTIQNQVDRETRFTNEFDQFVAEPGESLVSVYNRFAQLMNDLERNNMKFPIVFSD
ncbi:hypothetical protein Tco_0098917 [Tanacetum coccineum]